MMMQAEQAAAAVDAARALLADADAFASATPAELQAVLAGTAELSRVVDGLQVRLAEQIAERSKGPAEDAMCRRLGHRSAKEAIASAFGIRAGAAQALISLAELTAPALGLSGGEIAAKYPRVGAALTEGDLSLAQASTIVRHLEPAAPRADLGQLAWAEEQLVQAATDPAFRLVPELLVTQARVFAAMLDPDGVLPTAERRRAMRSLRIRELPDGMWQLTMICPPEAAAAIKALLDAYTSPRVKITFRDDEPCDSTTCQTGDSVDEGDSGATDGDGADKGDCGATDGGSPGADASDGAGAGDRDRAGAGADTGDDRDGPDCNCGRDVDANEQPSADGTNVVDDRTREQKSHDVILGLVQAHAASGDAPVAGGEPPTLVFTGSIDAYNAYLHGTDHPDRTLTIEHTGALVPIESIGPLACDARIQHAITDARGHVLALGTTQRLFNRAQRRALAARDKGCRVPGCRIPAAWCEAHHITPWEAGGPTDVDNGILACSYHHHEIHAGRLIIEKAGPEPGNWRIVPELRPADRYARTTRARRATPTSSAIAVGISGATGGISAPSMLAAGAAPSLAVKLPEHPPALATRPPRPRSSGVEARLRHLVRARRRPTSKRCAVDLGPPARIVMRT